MKKTELGRLVEILDGGNMTSDEFHKISSNKKISKASFSKNNEIPSKWIKIHFKTYPRLPSLKLKAPALNYGELGRIIKGRRSVRNFSDKPVTIEQLSYLFYYSAGLIRKARDINESKRPYASAGARYPLELYIISLNCKGMAKGLYHYNVKEHSLETLLLDTLNTSVLKITGGERWVIDAGVIFIITGVIGRGRVKYGDRAYRYMLIEAGSLLQNLCLAVSELGLGSCPLGGFIDDELNKLLDIQLQREYSLCMIPVGNK